MRGLAWGLMIFGGLEIIFVAIDRLLTSKDLIQKPDMEASRKELPLRRGKLRARAGGAIWDQASLHRRFLPLWILLFIGGAILLLFINLFDS